jgi:hypothetical protein
METMQPTTQTRLIHFLQEELLVSAESIAIAQRQEAMFPDLLPMVLWQYGLITIEQLEQVFDWLETA